MPSPAAHLAIAILIGVGTAACGDTEPPDGAAEPVDCGERTGETVVVEVGDFAFDPTPVQVETCDEVVWRNAHTQAHTSTGNGDERWSTGNIAPGAESEPIVFEAAGDLTYICALHPFMKGTVEVS